MYIYIYVCIYVCSYVYKYTLCITNVCELGLYVLPDISITIIIIMFSPYNCSFFSFIYFVSYRYFVNFLSYVASYYTVINVLKIT